MFSSAPGTTGEGIPQTIPTVMAIAAFTAVAWYNVLELNVQVFFTFKRHRGLYFWSLLISSYGCLLHALGFLLKFFQLTSNDYLSVTIITIGWYAMVTGQAVVLYSRLHLVIREQRILRGVLSMIIVNVLILHIPTTVLTYGSNSNQPSTFTDAFNVMERIQMTGFCLQEFIISGIYLHATVKFLHPLSHGRTRKVMLQLIWINLIIIAMDVVLLVMEYDNNYDIEATLKAMVYSIKLKLEFAVLNQLMTLANSSVHNVTNAEEVGNSPSSLDPPNLPPTIGSKGRSKSVAYLANHFPKSRTLSKVKDALHVRTNSLPTSDFSPRSAFDFDDKPYRTHIDWVPSFDRHHVLDQKVYRNHSPETPTTAVEPPNPITNPAAYYSSEKHFPTDPFATSRFPPHDGLGTIPSPPSAPASPTSRPLSPTIPISPRLSPSLTGSTLDDAPPSRKHRTTLSTFSNASRHTRATSPPTSPKAPRFSKRAKSPKRQDFTVPVVRSSRPSVSDWAHGSGSESGVDESEVALDPSREGRWQREANGSGPQGREMGLEFMTSVI